MKRMKLSVLMVLIAQYVFPQTDYFRDWLVCGPFANDSSGTRLTQDYLGGESQIRPSGGEITRGKTWVVYHSPQKDLNLLNPTLGYQPDERCVAYTCVYVYSPQQQSAKLLVGSDDGIVVWCNGIKVHQLDVIRGVTLDSDEISVTLNAGWNALLFKVANNEGGWGVAVRFGTGDGLKVQTENPFKRDSLTPPLIKLWNPTLADGFGIDTSDNLYYSFGMNLVNSGMQSATNVKIGIVLDGEVQSERVLPAINGGEIVPQSYRLPFDLLIKEAIDKGSLGFIASYGGQQKMEMLDAHVRRRVLERIFSGWKFEGWKAYTEGTTKVVRRAFNVPKLLKNMALELMVDIGSYLGTVKVNGEVKRERFGGDSGDLELTREAKANERFLIEIVVTPEKADTQAILKQAVLRLRNKDVERYLDDVVLAKEAYHVDAGDQTETEKELLSAIKSHDIDEVETILKPVTQKIAVAARVAKSQTLHFVGNAHIDMAWLWRYPETIDVCRQTFQAAIDNMRIYPDFRFLQGSAQSYLWMEDMYPDLFKEIHRFVQEGKWEIVGGTWVESDANIPSGESLARQYLYGKRYFKKKFGVDVKVGWMPDTFGHAATLPQILTKSGIETYVFFRPGETQRFFWWEAPDGSRILAHHPAEWYGTWTGIPRDVWKVANQTQRSFGLNDAVFYYGVGDHGGGPTRREVEKIHHLAELSAFPNAKLSRMDEYYTSVLRQRRDSAVNSPKDFPVIKGEQNFVFQGCYTSQANIKLGNRRAESLLPTAETFSSLAMNFGFQYPQDSLEKAWHRVLFNQFHDLLDGSGIGDIYLDAKKWYDEAFSISRAALDSSLKTIAAQVNTASRYKDAVPLVIFNPLNWQRTDAVEVSVGIGQGRSVPTVCDDRGREQKSQVVSSGKDSVKFVFIAKDVPGFGYKTYWIRLEREKKKRASSEFSFSNEFLRVDVDFFKTGSLLRVFDNVNKRSVLTDGGLGNQLQVQKDLTGGSAWEIGLVGEKTDIVEPSKIDVVENGDVRKVIRATYDHENSRFGQYVMLYSGIPRLDFRMEIDWKHRNRILKIAFPVNVDSGKATYEIPFGSIEREANGEEVVAQKWVDVSNNDCGVSLLNDCKYGFDVKGNVIRMTALRAPTDPDPKADSGYHVFSYSLFPHKGGWRDGNTVRRGYEFNTPLIPVIVQPHKGDLPSVHSFIKITPENIVVTACKKSEDSEDLLLRFYEAFGKATKCKITLFKPAARVTEVNLIEWNEKDLGESGREIELNVGAWEVKTLKVSF